MFLDCSTSKCPRTMNSRNQDARRRIGSRRRKLEQEIDRAFSEKRGSADICRLVANLEVIHKYEKRICAPQRRKVLLACFLTFAIAPILWGMYTRTENVSIDMNAFVSEATFVVAEKTPLLAPDARQLEIVRPLVAGSMLLNRLRVNSSLELRRYDNVEVTHVSALPGTAIRIKHDGKRCAVLEVAKANSGNEIAGRALTIISNAVSPDGVGTKQYDIYLGQGDSILLCDLRHTHFPILVGSISSVEFRRVYKDDAPSLRVSTLVKGVLKIEDTGRAFDLSPNDMVNLEELHSTQMLAGWRKGLVHFSVGGELRAGFLRSNYPSYAKGMALVPSVFVLMVQSPVVLALSFLVGLLGAIWNLVELWRR